MRLLGACPQAAFAENLHVEATATDGTMSGGIAGALGLDSIGIRSASGASAESDSARALLSRIVRVTLVWGLDEASTSFQVTSVPSALAVPEALAVSGRTLAFGSAKVPRWG